MVYNSKYNKMMNDNMEKESSNKQKGNNNAQQVRPKFTGTPASRGT